MTLEPCFAEVGITIHCADALDVLPQLSGGVSGAVVTDRPYSSVAPSETTACRGAVNESVQTGTLAYRPDFSGDTRDQRSFLAWATLWLNVAGQASVAGAPVGCFTDWRQLPTTTDAVQAAGWTWRGIAVWSKGYGRVSGAGMSAACEFVVWGTNGPAPEREDYPPGLFEGQPERGEDEQHVARNPSLSCAGCSGSPRPVPSSSTRTWGRARRSGRRRTWGSLPSASTVTSRSTSLAVAATQPEFRGDSICLRETKAQAVEDDRLSVRRGRRRCVMSIVRDWWRAPSKPLLRRPSLRRGSSLEVM